MARRMLNRRSDFPDGAMAERIDGIDGIDIVDIIDSIDNIEKSGIGGLPVGCWVL